MSLSAGTRLGPYVILSALGAGGMGEVYRATDTKLKRQVAVKILPASLADDPDRLARFQREAEVLASLNHPHIAHIHGLEDTDGVKALVMELVEGDDLTLRIARGPIPIEEALLIARQIAEALEAAHEQGIVHRDLKPANIKVRPDGTVKVLDFGLAKAVEPAGSSSADPVNSPTLTARGTKLGMLIGTAAYMSPEQARGKGVDKRADVWAFGVVLYEMLTGQRAFQGDDTSDVLAAVLRQDIEWAALPADTPPRIRRLLDRCLDRDAKTRLRDIGEARVELSRIQSGAPDGPVSPRPAPAGTLPRGWERTAWAAVVALVAAAFVMRSLASNPGAARDRPIRFQISAPASTTFDFLDENAGAPAISPDGRQIVFVAGVADGTSRLLLRSLDGLQIRDLASTEGAQHPFWSFDSRSVGFYADGKLKTVDVGGGAPHTVCDLRNLRGGLRGGTWSANGVILFSTGTFFGLYRVPASGGIPTAVTTLDRARDENSHRWPAFLPDGQHFLYFVRTSHPETTGIYVGTLDSNHGQFLIAAESGPVYAAPGHLLFVRQGALLGQPFNARALRVTGDPFTVVEQVALGGITREGMFTVSDTGVLAYWNGANLPRTLSWFGRNGERLGTIGTPLAYRNPAISPDGSRVAVEIFDAATGATDIWILDAATGVPTRFTFERGHRRYPVWSPDGARIVYQSDHEGSPALYEKASSGAGVESAVLKPTGAVTITPIDWSPGRDASLIYQVNDPLHDVDIWMLPLKTRVPVPVVLGPFDQSHPRVSPDGQWMVYVSNESGRQEVYVQTFPGPGGTAQVSTTGGTEPQWRRDGGELYYLGTDRRIMAVPAQATRGRFSAGVPTALFAAPLGTLDIFARNHFAPSADGRRFLVNGLGADVVTAPITVVTNWLADVKR